MTVHVDPLAEPLLRLRVLVSALGGGADPLLGVARAAAIVPSILPDEFPTPESFSTLRFEEARDLRDLAREMIDLARLKTGRDSILFLIDDLEELCEVVPPAAQKRKRASGSAKKAGSKGSSTHEQD